MRVELGGGLTVRESAFEMKRRSVLPDEPVAAILILRSLFCRPLEGKGLLAEAGRLKANDVELSESQQNRSKTAR